MAPRYPYNVLAVPLNREFRNRLNENFTNIALDLQELGAGAMQAIVAAEEATTQALYAQDRGDFADEKGLYAEEQGDFALAQGTIAGDKATEAETAAQTALDAAASARTNGVNPVDNFAAIATTYPNPEDGDEVQTTDDGKVYRRQNGNWEFVYELTPGPIANLTQQLADTQNLENFEVRSNKRELQPLIVFTLDDGGIHDYQTVLPILSTHGFVASSGIITNQVGNSNFPYTMPWQQIIELQNAHGWEITSHATDDVDLTTLSAQQVDDKLRVAKEVLLAQGLECRNFFLPRGNYNDTIKQISRKYYRSTRISGAASTGAIVNVSPFDMYQVDCRFFGDSTGVGQAIDGASGHPYDSVDYFKYYIDQAIALNGVLVIGMHGNTLEMNNRENDLDLICQYIQSKGIPVVTYNEMLNRVGNIMDTPKFKVGSTGKIGGSYGKIKVGEFNEVLNSTSINDIEGGYVNVSTVGNGSSGGLPLDTGGTMASVKPDNDVNRSFQMFKPYGRDRGLHFRDFTPTEVNSWQRLDNVFVHPINSLSSSHGIFDLKAGRINYCTIQTASASGYPENAAGFLIADFNTTLNTMVREEYRINNSTRVYDRYWNGSAWTSWILRNFDDNFKAKMNQVYTAPSIVSARVTNLKGGFIKIENMVHVNVKFTAAITGNGVLPLSGFPYSTVATVPQLALSAINVTDAANVYAVLQINNGQLSTNLTSDKEYVISGIYSLV